MIRIVVVALFLAACSASGDEPADAGVASDAHPVEDASAQPDASTDDVACGRPLDPEEALFQQTFVPKTSISDFPDPTAPIQPNHVAQTTEVAVHCIGAAAAERRARQCASFDTSFRAKLVPAVEAAVAWLKGAGGQWHNWGGPGYGLPASFDAFQDGTTDPASTIFAYETGYAVWCLSEAADVLGDASIRAIATSVLENYSAHAYTTTSVDCPGCGYFWYSMASADANRYVKNTNIELGLASLVYNRYGADTNARTRGKAAVMSQNQELAVRKNHEYLGFLDPAYVPNETFVDGHTSMEISMLYLAGQLLQSSEFEQTALDFMAFVETTSTYAGHPTYVVDSQCALARTHPTMLAPCAAYATLYPGRVDLAIFPLVLDYAF